jgi:hypothetical protein
VKCQTWREANKERWRLFDRRLIAFCRHERGDVKRTAANTSATLAAVMCHATRARRDLSNTCRTVITHERRRIDKVGRSRGLIRPDRRAPPSITPACSSPRYPS